MVLSRWWALWQKRISWRHHVEHIARACAAEVAGRLSDSIQTMSLAERTGYLYAKATPVVTAHVILHGRQLPPGQRLSLQSEVHRRVVELLAEQLHSRRRYPLRNAA